MHDRKRQVRVQKVRSTALALIAGSAFVAATALAADPPALNRSSAAVKAADPLFKKRSIEPRRTQSEVVRIERVIDGMIVISSPYEAKLEPGLLRGGYRKVSSRDKATDMALFEGRVFRMVRLAVQDTSAFQRAVGTNVILDVTTNSGTGGAAITGFRPAR